jgi:plasmid replication initiation protein
MRPPLPSIYADQTSSLVKQHNALTTARYSYSELQMDFLFFLLSKLRVNSEDLVYRLPLLEMSALTGRRYNYKYLQQATEDMGSRMFGVKTSGSYDQLWLFQKVSYLDGQGIIEIKLSEDMLPYLFDLKNNYTTYALQAAFKLSSKYAKRIYQLCSQWKDKPETPPYPLYDLKHILGLVDPKTDKEEYKLFGDFKSKVLTLAIQQVNQHTDLRVELVTHKVGRGVKAISFKIDHQAYALPIEFSPEYKLAPPAPAGINEGQMESAERFLDEVRVLDDKLRHTILSSTVHLKKLFAFAHDLRTGKVKASNPGGYLLTVLGLKEAKTPLPKATRAAKRS